MLASRSPLIAAILVPLLFIAGGSHSANARDDRRIEWRTGHWIHDRHGGRLGWWWVVGPSWHFYERPYIPSQTVVVESPPQVVMVQPQPAPPPPVMVVQPQQSAPVQSPVLYYCKATGTHYPETMSCPGGWMTMTASTPPEH